MAAVRSGLARAWSWRKTAALVLAALALLWFVLIPGLLGPVVECDAVVRADFVQSVVASGHVEAPFRINIGSQITGIVAEIPVAEGQMVKAGETLIVLDDHEPRAAVVQAEGVVAQAQARFRQILELTFPSAEEALRQSNATLANAQPPTIGSRNSPDGVATRRRSTMPRGRSNRPRPGSQRTSSGVYQPARRIAITSWPRRSFIRRAPASRPPNRASATR